MNFDDVFGWRCPICHEADDQHVMNTVRAHLSACHGWGPIDFARQFPGILVAGNRYAKC
jgi:hypothetical protein